MGDFTVAITVGSPAETVFAFLADPTNLSQWLEAVEGVTVRAGTSGRGTRFEMVRSLPGGRVINDVVLTELEPARRVAFESRTGPTPFRYDYRLQPTATGTRVTLAGTIGSDGLPSPLAGLGGLATQLFKHGMRRNLRTLDRVLSARAANGEDR